MFGFGKKKETPGHRKAPEKFLGISSSIRAEPKEKLAELGLAVNMVSRLFEMSFGTVQRFRGHTAAEQASFIQMLSAMEAKFREPGGDSAQALACNMFGMWLGCVVRNDNQMADLISTELVHLGGQGPAIW